MKRLTTTAAFLLMSAGMSFAAINTDAVVADLQGKGYTSIEVKTGPTQIKIEAVRGSETMEVVYDTATGNVLKTETGAVRAGDDIKPGLSIRTEDKDFLDAGDQSTDDSGSPDGSDDSGGSDGSDDNGDSDGGDDSGGDDSGGDDSGGDDNGGDDNGGDDNGSDDNGGDDNGGDDNGGDDNGSDDNGGDDNGSDDNGGDDNGGDDNGSDD